MRDEENFVIESGVELHPKKAVNRDGKWKTLALKMKPPGKDPQTGNIIYDSVSHTKEGVALNRKEAMSLCNALTRLGSKSATRRNGNDGFRVWRIG